MSKSTKGMYIMFLEFVWVFIDLTISFVQCQVKEDRLQQAEVVENLEEMVSLFVKYLEIDLRKPC